MLTGNHEPACLPAEEEAHLGETETGLTFGSPSNSSRFVRDHLGLTGNCNIDRRQTSKPMSTGMIIKEVFTLVFQVTVNPIPLPPKFYMATFLPTPFINPQKEKTPITQPRSSPPPPRLPCAMKCDRCTRL